AGMKSLVHFHGEDILCQRFFSLNSFLEMSHSKNRVRTQTLKDNADFFTTAKSLGLCRWSVAFTKWMNLEDLAEGFYLATGLRTTVRALKKTGERVFNLQRAFNNLQGLNSKDDVFSAKLVPFIEKRFKKDVGSIRKEYYAARGWDPKTGIPARKKLEELGLSGAAKELSKLKNR
ncbi:MAG TPA: aldehyde ferredoxin oxidoreductase C-terminal domain-containing protein, partial [bacterium]|nr:aldehyde ferredoxin oxidoreductase C-terminal domain-containing protein [bacterium]